MTNALERIREAQRRNRSFLCVGLDPDPSRLPAGVSVSEFLRQIIDATADLVCCYKPNLAFYEAMGREGFDALEALLRQIPRSIPVLGDAKRGDIGNTSEAYARAMFDHWGFDAVTVNPWGGADAVLPFIERRERGVFVWCRGSNPGSADFQDQLVQTASGARPVYELVAERAADWNSHGNVGLVAGATVPEQIARVRSLCPDMLLLVPGVGAQGGDLEAAVAAARDAGGGGFLINASRQVLFAGDGENFAMAARTAATKLMQQINQATA